MAKGLQGFYYDSFLGQLLGSKEREKIVDSFISRCENVNSFLDAGCAEGHYLSKFQEKFKENVGLEFDEHRSLRASQNLSKKALVVRGSVENLPFKDNSFDLVLCSEVLEHIPDWKKALSELQRVSRKYIVLTIPLEKAFFWRFFSIIAPPITRGHLHRLGSLDIKHNLNGKFKLIGSEKVYLPFFNSMFSQNTSEKYGIYSCFLLEKSESSKKK